MRLLIQLLAFLGILWLLRMLWRAVSGERSSRLSGPAGGSKPIAEELKRDPQCGTYVSPAISHKLRQGGEELHFCSQQCQEAYLRARAAAAK